MNKFEIFDALVQKNKGYLKTSDAAKMGISRAYLGDYVKERGLECVVRGLYMSRDTWNEGMYIIQVRYPEAIFFHVTAMYLHGLADHEPIRYTLTLRTGQTQPG